MSALAAAILPATLGALFLCFLRQGAVREAVLRAAIAFGVLVVLLTEVLGLVAMLRPAPVLFGWAAAAAAALYCARPFPRPPLLDWARALRRKPLEAVLLSFVCVVFTLVAVVAFASAPNSADAMTYHLPRVLYWMQQGSTENFPTEYLNQIMLQPLAEYFVLHSFILSGGDRFANLVQLFGFAVSAVGVSAVARELGASSRGQAAAVVFCATLPNAILQASGAKNDCLLAAWLVATTYFALRWAKKSDRGDLAALGAGVGLALFTKGTAYLFLPAMLAGVFLGCNRLGRVRLLKAAPACLAATLLLNVPFYLRNIELSGSPLGFDSAHGNGFFRWQNEAFNARNTLSNLIRHLSEQLGGRSEEWNQGVYNLALGAHEGIGADPNDPATTWRWTRFEPPRNANHEANANNRRHLLLLALAAFPILFGFARRGCERAAPFWYGTALVLSLLFFCFYLKWQPFQARVLLPLFIAASPLFGLVVDRVPAFAVLLLCFYLADGSRLALEENWTRPLTGPKSVLRIARTEGYFADLTPWDNRRSYLDVVERAAQSGCGQVGIDATHYEIEYPFQALLREHNPEVRFFHVGVDNASVRYTPDPPPRPCAVLCMDCAGVDEKLNAYAHIGEPFISGKFVLFIGPR